MLGKSLQDAFRGAAQEADVHFVDVYSASQGHDACAPDGQRWVEGQTPPAVVPYHPNAMGMRAPGLFSVTLPVGNGEELTYKL
jgi:hypothetical protein